EAVLDGSCHLHDLLDSCSLAAEDTHQVWTHLGEPDKTMRSVQLPRIEKIVSQNSVQSNVLRDIVNNIRRLFISSLRWSLFVGDVIRDHSGSLRL
ncbi:hypothetical protein PMAYCL1PPCAC_05771, partial [Pristionchus mayeri]